jgi:p-hydroxybenzoate 3-monooxygenase
MLVADLLDALRNVGGEVAFNRPVKEVTGAEAPQFRLDDGDLVTCDFVLGCDGFHGVARPALAGVSCSGVGFDAEWLALLAQAPPSSDHTVYALHADGFAGHMLRSPTVSRFYLQTKRGGQAETWNEACIWDQLCERLAAKGVEPTRGAILERSTLQLHSYVTERCSRAVSSLWATRRTSSRRLAGRA